MGDAKPLPAVTSHHHPAPLHSLADQLDNSYKSAPPAPRNLPPTPPRDQPTTKIHTFSRDQPEQGRSIEMGDQGNASSCRGRRGPAGFGLALARLVRRLRRRSKMLVCTAAPTGASSRCRQYDPLSYARNFDRDGFGSALDDDVSGAGHLCHHYTFASRFVLASSSSVRQPQ